MTPTSNGKSKQSITEDGNDNDNDTDVIDEEKYNEIEMRRHNKESNGMTKRSDENHSHSKSVSSFTFSSDDSVQLLMCL